MEKAGFFVTKDGCIFPSKYYRLSEQGSKVKGYQRMAYYQTGLCVNKERADDRSKRYVGAQMCVSI